MDTSTSDDNKHSSSSSSTSHALGGSRHRRPHHKPAMTDRQSDRSSEQDSLSEPPETGHPPSLEVLKRHILGHHGFMSSEELNRAMFALHTHRPTSSISCPSNGDQQCAICGLNIEARVIPSFCNGMVMPSCRHRPHSLPRACMPCLRYFSNQVAKFRDNPDGIWSSETKKTSNIAVSDDPSLTDADLDVDRIAKSMSVGMRPILGLVGDELGPFIRTMPTPFFGHLQVPSQEKGASHSGSSDEPVSKKPHLMKSTAAAADGATSSSPTITSTPSESFAALQQIHRDICRLYLFTDTAKPWSDWLTRDADELGSIVFSTPFELSCAVAFRPYTSPLLALARLDVDETVDGLSLIDVLAALAPEADSDQMKGVRSRVMAIVDSASTAKFTPRILLHSANEIDIGLIFRNVASTWAHHWMPRIRPSSSGSTPGAASQTPKLDLAFDLVLVCSFWNEALPDASSLDDVARILVGNAFPQASDVCRRNILEHIRRSPSRCLLLIEGCGSGKEVTNTTWTSFLGGPSAGQKPSQTHFLLKCPIVVATTFTSLPSVCPIYDFNLQAELMPANFPLQHRHRLRTATSATEQTVSHSMLPPAFSPKKPSPAHRLVLQNTGKPSSSAMATSLDSAEARLVRDNPAIDFIWRFRSTTPALAYVLERALDSQAGDVLFSQGRDVPQTLADTKEQTTSTCPQWRKIYIVGSYVRAQLKKARISPSLYGQLCDLALEALPGGARIGPASSATLEVLEHLAASGLILPDIHVHAKQDRRFLFSDVLTQSFLAACSLISKSRTLQQLQDMMKNRRLHSLWPIAAALVAKPSMSILVRPLPHGDADRGPNLSLSSMMEALCAVFEASLHSSNGIVYFRQLTWMSVKMLSAMTGMVADAELESWKTKLARLVCAKPMYGEMGFSDMDVKTLVEIAGRSTSPAWLCLSCNSFGHHGVAAIARAVEAGSNIIGINLGFNDLTEETILMFVRSLKDKPVQQVYLCGLDVTDAIAVELSNVLKSSASLSLLDLSDTGITDTGVMKLAGALAGNESLRVLYLDRNFLTNKSARALGNAIKQHPQFKAISLIDNKLTDEGALHVTVGMASLGSCDCYASFWCNPVSDVAAVAQQAVTVLRRGPSAPKKFTLTSEEGARQRLKTLVNSFIAERKVHPQHAVQAFVQWVNHSKFRKRDTRCECEGGPSSTCECTDCAHCRLLRHVVRCERGECRWPKANYKAR